MFAEPEIPKTGAAKELRGEIPGLRQPEFSCPKFSCPMDWLGKSSCDLILVTLQPGSCTAQVSGVGGAAGVALVEVCEVP